MGHASDKLTSSNRPVDPEGATGGPQACPCSARDLDAHNDGRFAIFGDVPEWTLRVLRNAFGVLPVLRD